MVEEEEVDIGKEREQEHGEKKIRKKEESKQTRTKAPV